MDPYRHILCATDLSADGSPACERAAAVARCFDARLTLLHVVEFFPEDRSNDDIAPEDVDPRDYAQRRARERLAALARDAGCADAELVVRFASQSSWHEILDYAGAQGADLIVVSEHEHGGLKALVPTTARHLSAHHASDVLVVPAAAP